MDLDIAVGMLPVVCEYASPMDEVLPMESLARGGDGVTVDLLGVEGVVGLLEPFVDPPECARTGMTDEFLDNRPQDADML